jgi:competence CoiA-like predicted nuclease
VIPIRSLIKSGRVTPYSISKVFPHDGDVKQNIFLTFKVNHPDHSRTMEPDYYHDSAGPRLLPVHFEFSLPAVVAICVVETFNEWQSEAKILHSARGGRWLKNAYPIYWPVKPCPTHLARETRFWR